MCVRVHVCLCTCVNCILCDCAPYRSLSCVRYLPSVSSRILNECVFVSEPKKRQCKALFEYVPQNEDELELKVGEIIDITEEVSKSVCHVICIRCGFKSALNMFVLLFIEILIRQMKRVFATCACRNMH